MADPQLLLRQRFAEALERIDPSLAGADPVIRPSQHADFQVNSAMALGKRLGRNPRELADQLLAEVELAGIVVSTDQPELAKQFLEFMLTDAFQSAIPETNWMYPAVTPVEGLPKGFDQMTVPEKALLYSPAEAEAVRKPALDEWRDALSQ